MGETLKKHPMGRKRLLWIWDKIHATDTYYMNDIQIAARRKILEELGNMAGRDDADPNALRDAVIAAWRSEIDAAVTKVLADHVERSKMAVSILGTIETV